MKRNLLISLEAWKDDPMRVPLILRGARQVGKSWLVREFSKGFEHFVEFNFERSTEIHEIFAGDLAAETVLEKLSLHAQQKIIPGKTLLFLDEIQVCERALIALRYFKEECPALHVIAAGSLLDFVLENIGMPVGRVQFLYLYPLSFSEFLEVSGHGAWREYLLKNKNSGTLHTKLLDLLKQYCWLGGMPEVLDTWLQYKDPERCQMLQERIVQAYKQDFLKYAKANRIEQVDKVFSSVPQQLGKKFKYNQVDGELRALVLKEALNLLKQAGIVHIAYHSSGQALPLEATKNEKFFKVFFFDIGLAQRLLGLSFGAWLKQPLEVQHLGGIAEQLVAQEYIAYQNENSAAQVFCWRRENKYSNAELDFLFCKNQEIVPVEVKSSSKGRMQSLKIFLESHQNSPYGLKISSGEFAEQKGLREIPLYAIESWLKE